MSPAANERDERREHHILAGWLLFYHERKKELEENPRARSAKLRILEKL